MRSMWRTGYWVGQSVAYSVIGSKSKLEEGWSKALAHGSHWLEPYTASN